jgi:ClpP class serine protease
MNLPALVTTAPLAILPGHAGPALAALGTATPTRPARRPVYRPTADGGFDLEEDYSLAAQHNAARLLIQTLPNGTALIAIKGMILKNAPAEYMLEGYCTSLTLLDLALDMVAQQGYAALILNIESGGGSTLGLPETAARLRALSAQGIRTTAYTAECCASAAYWIAAACDEIFASPSAILGSIGTYAVITDYSEMLTAAGIKTEVFVARAAPLKTTGLPGTSLTDAQRADIQRHVDEVDLLFLTHLTTRRPALNLDQAATGAWWNAASPTTPPGLVDDAHLFHSLNDLLTIAAA